MIKIAITVEAFDALASTLPIGSVAPAKILDSKRLTQLGGGA